MGEPFIDTDVIVRLLTGDDLAKQTNARALFEAVEAGEIVVTAPSTVIFDVVFVLSSPRTYHLSREAVRDLLMPILRPACFRVENKQALMRALDTFASTNLPFGDAMIVATMEAAESTVLYSYDREFGRVPWIDRREPGLRLA